MVVLGTVVRDVAGASRPAVTAFRSVLRGRYLVQNPLWNTWLRGSDTVLELFGESRDEGIPVLPRRLLLAVGGHLGDAVIATSVLAPLRAKWPHIEIGVLSGSWNRQVLAALPEVKWFHAADHWKLNRSPSSLLARATRFTTMSSAAIREMTDVGYDVAIDLYPYYPNAGSLLRRANIPVRVGYTSGGGGAHYTRRLDWKDEGHVTNDHRRLLELLGVDMGAPRYRLPPADASTAERARRELRTAGMNGDRYVVLHMGAGNPAKQWPATEWKTLAGSLSSGGYNVVLTGSGSADRVRTGELARTTGAVDMCDRLDWSGFMAVLAGARAVVSVDTVAAHMSAGLGTPTAVVATGVEIPGRWNPIGEKVVVLDGRSNAAQVSQALASFLR